MARETTTVSALVGPSVLLFLGMALFGSATPVSKLVGQQLPLVPAAGARLLLAGLVLLPFALCKLDGLFRLTKRDWLLVVGVAVIGNVGFSLFMLYGMQLVSGVLGSVIMSLTPAVTALAAVAFLRETINCRKLLALGLGVTGVLVMHVSSSAEDSGHNVPLGALLVFAAVCSEAAYTLLGKTATDDMSPLKLATLSALISGVLLLPWMIIEGPNMDFEQIAPANWAALLWWGIGTMALGSLFWYSGVQRVPGHIAAGFMAVMPISALVLSYVLLGEHFLWTHLAGFGLAIAGVVLMSREHQSAER